MLRQILILKSHENLKIIFWEWLLEEFETLFTLKLCIQHQRQKSFGHWHCLVFQKQVKTDKRMRPENFLLLDLGPHLCAFLIVFKCGFSSNPLMYYDACVFPKGYILSSNLLLFTLSEYVFSIGLHKLIHTGKPYKAFRPFSHLWSPKAFLSVLGDNCILYSDNDTERVFF